MDIPKLHELFLAHPIVSTDTRKIMAGSIFFALKGDNFNGNSYASEALKKGAAYAIIDEGECDSANNYIQVKDVLSTLQQLATYHRQYCKAKVIGLTGSNGKTTTKELIHSVLKKKYRTVATKGNLNNHIGVPLTLLSIKENTEIAIVEMGANHQKEIEFLSSIAQPDFGYITNFGKAHLEGFGGVEGVIKGKSELYDYLISHDKHVFLNADDPLQLEKLAGHIKKFGFSISNREYFNIHFEGANPFVKLRLEDVVINTQLIGSYNFTNCAIAVLIGKYFNVKIDEIKSALEGYVPANNRSQILTKNGHRIILDAYNANPTSMKAALENFSKIEGDNKIAFLGDMFELGETAAEEHQLISDLASELKLDSVFLIGKNFFNSTSTHKKFNSFDSLSAFLKENPLSENSTLLVKGSRGMALERLLDLL